MQALKVGSRPAASRFILRWTPGANIADGVIRRIDTNRDAVLSPDEAEAYGGMVIADLFVRLDDRDVSMALTRVEVPMPGDLRTGTSVIRIEAFVDDTRARGEHRLSIRNTHLTPMSVYLANALLPESSEIVIVKQSRDAIQQNYELTYRIGESVSHRWMWTLFAFASLGVLVSARAVRTSSCSLPR